MPTPTPWLGRALALGLALALWAPWGVSPAGAAGREWNGEILRAGGGQIVVGNRMGDERRFERSETTRVQGKAWEDLAAGDRVIVQYVRRGERSEVTRVIVLGER